MIVDPPSLTCSECGQPVDGRDLDFRFKLPDPLLTIPPADRDRQIQGSGDGVWAEDGTERYLRALLHVRLTEGCTIRYGTWVGLTSPTDWNRASAWWHAPEYANLAFDARLANAIEPWGEPLMGRVHVAVRAQNELPYIESFADEKLNEVLTTVWSRDWVLAAIPEEARTAHQH
jgi:hypothetical protein